MNIYKLLPYLILIITLYSCSKEQEINRGFDRIKLEPGQRIYTEESSVSVTLNGSIKESNENAGLIIGSSVTVLLDAGSQYEKCVASTGIDHSGAFLLECTLPCGGVAENTASITDSVPWRHYLWPFTIRIHNKDNVFTEKRYKNFKVALDPLSRNLINVGTIEISQSNPSQ